MNKDDLRVIKTRTAIKKAFLELLNSKPFQDITVKEITNIAQCNRNTFYLHYVDKYDLLEKLCASSLENMEKSLYETYEKQYPSNMDWYSDIAKICLDTIELDMPFYGITSEKNRHSHFADQFRELLVGFIYTGLEQAGKQPKRLEIEFSANGMVGVLRFWLANQTEYSKEDVFKELFNFIVRLGSVIFE